MLLNKTVSQAEYFGIICTIKKERHFAESKIVVEQRFDDKFLLHKYF
jgi:hypothetical protein